MNVVLVGHSQVEEFHVFTPAVTHALANGKSAAVPHAEVRALLMSGRSGFRPAFVFCGSGDCGSTDGEHRYRLYKFAVVQIVEDLRRETHIDRFARGRQSPSILGSNPLRLLAIFHRLATT